MKNIIPKLLFTTLFFTILTVKTHAIIAGSDASVSLQSFTTFPAADNDNSMYGFGWFHRGFGLQNSSTTCVFDSVYPIGGNVAMHGGTIILNKDMIFKDTIVVDSFGTFIGNGRNLDFTRSTLTGSIPPSANFENVSLYFAGNFFVANAFHFKGTCLVDGAGAVLTFLGPLAAVVVDDNSTLTLRNMTLKGVSGTRIRNAFDSGKIIFNNVNLELASDYIFSKGSFSIVNTVDVSGSHSLIYDSTQTSTISSGATLRIADNALFSLGKSSDASPIQPLSFVDQTSVLNLVDSTLHVNSHGAQFTKGTLQFTGANTLESSATTSAQALILGNGVSAHDQFFIFDPSSVLEIVGGYLDLNVIQQDLLLSKVGGARINQRTSNFLMIDQNQIITNLTLGGDPGAVAILAPGKTLLFSNTTNITPFGSFIINGYFVDGTSQLLNGGQSLILNGALPLITLVSNTGNSINGVGNVIAPIILENSNAQLVWTAQGTLGENIYLNGGIFTLLNDLSIDNNMIISGSGIIDLNGKNLNFGNTDLTFNDSLLFDMELGSIINLGADITLNSTWTFSGICQLNAHGNKIDLSNGALIIAEGSCLLLENVTLKGVSGNNIRCLDSAGILHLNNVLWLQNDSFTLDQGLLKLESEVTFRGNFLFSYQTTQTATILENTIVTMDNGFTFSYDPGTYPDLIQFTDLSSQLFLNQATIHATAQGMSLTKGTMVVLALGTLESEIVNGVDVGITLGDCFDMHNDFKVNLASCINFSVGSGSLNYKNVNSSSWLIINNLLLGDNTSLNVYKTLTNGTALTNFGVGSFLRTAPGATFNGSITGSPTVQMDVLAC